MTLNEWAKSRGIGYQVALRLFHAGTLPVKAEKLPTGRIVIAPLKKEPKTVIYARVSSADQKADLDRQVARLAEYAAAEGIVVSAVVREIGSGLNGRRKMLLGILSSSEDHILVEHRDRLARFGFEFIEAIMAASARRIIVADEMETEDDVVRDLHEVIVSMCARLYGKRSAKNRAKRAIQAASLPG